MELRYKSLRFKPGILPFVAGLLIYKDIAIPLLVSIVFHEIGHLLSLFIFKAKISFVSFGLAGISINYDDRTISYKNEVISAAFGPLFSLILFIFCGYFGSIKNSEQFLITAGTSFTLLIFNMLPLSFLDGGKIIFTLLESEHGPYKAEKIKIISDFILSVFLFVFSLLMMSLGKMNATLLIFSITLIILCCKNSKIGVKF